MWHSNVIGIGAVHLTGAISFVKAALTSVNLGKSIRLLIRKLLELNL